MSEVIHKVIQDLGIERRQIPVQPTLENLEDAVDIAYGIGLCTLKTILEDESAKTENKISAMNALTSFGRYTIQRREFMNSSKSKLITDDPNLVIGGT